jgi:recombinational DNA repair protein (RecF pathway)
MGQQRHLSTEAIILKTSTSSEINKNFIFISPDLGIQHATAFGAAKIKSRFCSAVQAFTKANLFLYKSPKTDFYKLERWDELSYIEQLEVRVSFLLNDY